MKEILVLFLLSAHLLAAPPYLLEDVYIKIDDQTIQFGFIALANPLPNKMLATWMETDGEVNYHPAIDSEQQRLTIRLQNNRHYHFANYSFFLHPNGSCVS